MGKPIDHLLRGEYFEYGRVGQWYLHGGCILTANNKSADHQNKTRSHHVVLRGAAEAAERICNGSSEREDAEALREGATRLLNIRGGDKSLFRHFAQLNDGQRKLADVVRSTIEGQAKPNKIFDHIGEVSRHARRMATLRTEPLEEDRCLANFFRLASDAFTPKDVAKAA